MSHTVTVAQDGSGDFTTIMQAVGSLPAHGPAEIYIRDGLYREKVALERAHTRIVGQSMENTILTWGDGALHPHPVGGPFKTFRTQTAFFGGKTLHVRNLTIQNTAGPGEAAGQAIAAYIDAKTACFSNVRLLGRQDTLFLAPLPPGPRIPHSFTGPREGAPRTPCTHYFERCYIQGDVDFIFGGATAAFVGCEIFSSQRVNPADAGYIAAPCTPEDQEWGMIFVHCRLTGDAPRGSVYLARPWREHAACAYINCHMGEHISPAGWDEWGDAENRKTARFAEYGSSGPGASPYRARWAHRLDQARAHEVLAQAERIARICKAVPIS